jgi:putative phage-type endonuclease
MPYRRELMQGTDAWLAWRRGGIGASDAPAIMGVSPWMDVDTLWLDKTGRGGAVIWNSAMRRGQQLEPIARDLYIRTTGVRVEPICLEHGEHRWMRGSFDGLSADGLVVLEIKCPGASAHATALRGQVPDKYVPQLQHLLAVSGAPVCHYWSYRAGAGTLIEVTPDPHYIGRLIEREQVFWQHVVEDRRPQPSLFG